MMADNLNRMAIMEMMMKMSENDTKSLLDRLNFKDVHQVMELLNSTSCYYSGERSPPDWSGIPPLTLYLPPIIFIVGLIGNGLSFAVLSRRPMRKISAYSYLTVLSLSDTVVLCIGFSKIWVAVVRPDLDLRLTYDILCRMTHMLGSTVSDFSVWLIVVVTIERYVVVCHPLKRSRVCRRRYACVVMLCLMAFTVLLNCHLLWTTRLKDPPNSTFPFIPPLHSSPPPPPPPLVICRPARARTCTFVEGHEVLVSHVWPWIDALVYSFLPFVAILVFNSLIIRTVARSKRKRTHVLAVGGFRSTEIDRGRTKGDPGKPGGESVKVTFMEVTGSEVGKEAAERKGAKGRATCPLTVSRDSAGSSSSRLGLMLLTVSCFFLVTTLPMNATLIATVLLKGFVSERSLGAKMETVHKVSEMLMYVNHSINFYLYCSTGAKFRRELCRMFTCSPERPWHLSTSANVCQPTSNVRRHHHHHHHQQQQQQPQNHHNDINHDQQQQQQQQQQQHSSRDSSSHQTKHNL